MDPVSANAERARRMAARFPPNTNPTDEERRLGENGAKQATGPELAHLTTLANARVRLAAVLRDFGKFEAQIMLYPDSDAAWRAYDSYCSQIEDAARMVAQLAGEPQKIPTRIKRIAREWTDIE
jgi:hypothetical protein